MSLSTQPPCPTSSSTPSLSIMHSIILAAALNDPTPLIWFSRLPPEEQAYLRALIFLESKPDISDATGHYRTHQRQPLHAPFKDALVTADGEARMRKEILELDLTKATRLDTLKLLVGAPGISKWLNKFLLQVHASGTVRLKHLVAEISYYCGAKPSQGRSRPVSSLLAFRNLLTIDLVLNCGIDDGEDGTLTHQCNADALSTFLSGSPNAVIIRLQLDTITQTPLNFRVLGLRDRTWEHLEEIAIAGIGVDFASSETEQVGFLDRHLHCRLVRFGDSVLRPPTSSEEQLPSTPPKESSDSPLPSHPERAAGQANSRRLAMTPSTPRILKRRKRDVVPQTPLNSEREPLDEDYDEEDTVSGVHRVAGYDTRAETSGRHSPAASDVIGSPKLPSVQSPAFSPAKTTEKSEEDVEGPSTPGPSTPCGYLTDSNRRQQSSESTSSRSVALTNSESSSNIGQLLLPPILLTSGESSTSLLLPPVDLPDAEEAAVLSTGASTPGEPFVVTMLAGLAGYGGIPTETLHWARRTSNGQVTPVTPISSTEDSTQEVFSEPSTPTPVPDVQDDLENVPGPWNEVSTAVGTIAAMEEFHPPVPQQGQPAQPAWEFIDAESLTSDPEGDALAAAAQIAPAIGPADEGWIGAAGAVTPGAVTPAHSVEDDGEFVNPFAPPPE